MDDFWSAVEHDLPTVGQFLGVSFHLLVATILGGVIGLERAHSGQAAGLRTHMLVALGTAMFMLVAIQSGASSADQSRVIQGIVTGIGFVGAGAILKIAESERVKGLTTAASIWATAAAGIAVGLGRLWMAVLGSFFAWLILSQLKGFEARVHPPQPVTGESKAPRKSDADAFAARR
jgi:putative Mg2+ transporter-C (MgtC) family protein